MSGEAGGCDETLPQGLFSLVRYGPVIGKDSTLQLVQVGGGKLHATPRAVSILIIAPLQTHTHTHNTDYSLMQWVTLSHTAGASALQ